MVWRVPVGLQVCGLKTVVPRMDIGTLVGPESTPEGAERSGALGAKRRVVRTGSRVTIVHTEETVERATY